MTLLGFRKQELSTCRSIAHMNMPQEYRLIYSHMAALGANRSGLNEESWINKMTVMTTKIWEKKNTIVDNPDIKELIEDIKLKHMNFK